MAKMLGSLLVLGAVVSSLACSSSSTDLSSTPVGGAGASSGGDSSTAGGGATSASAGASTASTSSGMGGAISTSTAGASGTTSGGTTSGGTTSGGATNGGAANGGASAGTGGAATAPTNFTCTEYLGLLTTNEWYSQGFEKDGVDGTKWELKYHHYGYVNTWADPTSVFWDDMGDSFDLAKGSPLQSPCAASSTAPDRLVFAALDWEMSTEDQWVTALEAALVTFKAKYPSLRWVDLMTMIRCPQNQKCNPKENYGAGANMDAGRQDCYVPPFEDSAIAKVAAAHPDFVGVGPQVEALTCKSPVDGAHLDAASNQHAAQLIATYYAAHP